MVWEAGVAGMVRWCDKGRMVVVEVWWGDVFGEVLWHNGVTGWVVWQGSGV